ncbi:glutamate synthase-related protein [Megamonas hypermegale]|uniref:glutamate synthase-related protein n=1 Tax=Megamonas hypermegale TaxID=158847 RepID=UPI0025A31A7E|nr:glutamate synthase-related protein [Megamonas hypermegale]MDM8144101.1 glutamate synthase-related protein [Megamonas hypermegale]
MEAVRTQDISVNDLNWKIEYDMNRCTMCGSCLATCTFHAIEADVLRIDKTTSDSAFPEPKHTHKAVPVIKQIKTLANACVGCGMCEKVCPNGAIRPVRNVDTRKTLLSRDNGPIKRGGRTNLNAQRTLDSIVVGRISQMTDPSLDSQRHTFDIRSPFGRVLPAKQLPFKMEYGKLVMDHKAPPVRWIYPLIFSDMSIGALSTRAWEAVALACAYLNEKCNIPIRMSSGEGGMPSKLLESDYLKYMIIQIASGHFGWNRIVKALPKMKVDPAGVLIKIGQGAKPGDGGLLQAAKVAEHVQAIRGVPKATLSSPPNHQGLYSIEESVQKMHLSMNAAFGFRVPVAIKCAASATSVSVYNNLLRDPYKICGGFFIDGIQGGTGAANEISLDHTGHPVVSKIRDCYLAAVKQGLQGQIPLYGGGGIGLTGNAAADAFKMICLGANGVFCGKILIQLLGCIGNEHGRCNACNTGKCPTGICTQDARLVKRLDIDKGAQKIVDYVLAFDAELRKLMAPIGNSSLPVGRSDALVSTDKAVADKLGIQYVC